VGKFVVTPPPDTPTEGEAPDARPRDLVDRPDMFGLWGKPMRPAEGVDPADARFIAANLQHWIANAVREEVLMRRSNLATLLPTLTTTSAEFTFDRVSRLQHGDEPFTLADLLIWSTRFESVRNMLTSSLGDTTRGTPAATTVAPASEPGAVRSTHRPHRS